MAKQWLQFLVNEITHITIKTMGRIFQQKVNQEGT